MDVDDRAVAEIALIENLQRKDLTPWEEADGLAALCERFGYTHAEVARKVGKSRSTVTEVMSIASLPESVREQCRRADINSKSLLLQIVRQPDADSMMRMAEEVIRSGMTRDDARATRRAQTGEQATQTDSKGTSRRPYVYRFVSPGKEFRLEMRFRRTSVKNSEIAAALREAADKLEREE
jgi:ParB family chromosome partitioning protein